MPWGWGAKRGLKLSNMIINSTHQDVGFRVAGPRKAVSWVTKVHCWGEYVARASCFPGRDNSGLRSSLCPGVDPAATRHRILAFP